MSGACPNRGLKLYFLLTIPLAWLFWIPMIAMQQGLLPFRIPVMIPSTLGALSPLFALAIVGKVTGRRSLLDDMIRRARIREALRSPLTAAVLLIPAATVLGEVLLALVSGTGAPKIIASGPDELRWWLVLIIPIQFATALLTSPLFEEPGWRGFALVELQKSYGPHLSSLIVGSYWWLWHQGMNLAFDVGPSLHGYFSQLALSFTIDSLFNLSGGNLFVAMLAHQAAGTAITFFHNTPNNPYSLGLMAAVAVALRIAARWTNPKNVTAPTPGS